MEWNEESLMITSQENCELFLETEKRSLITFTKDPRIQYKTNSRSTQLNFQPESKTLELPLLFFVDNDYEGYEMLWHIYFNLALYSDWKKNPKNYLNRLNMWNQEINQMTQYLIHAIDKSHSFSQDQYQVETIKSYVERELLDLLEEIDLLTALLTVDKKCPIYQQVKYQDFIKHYILESFDQFDDNSKHKSFQRSFIFYQCDAMNQLNSTDIIMGMPVQEFMKIQIANLIVQNKGITERDELVKNWFFPLYKRYWCEDIDAMVFVSESDESQTGNLEKVLGDQNDQESKVEMTKENKEALLEQLMDEAQTEEKLSGECVQIDFEDYGIDQDALNRFHYYKNSMRQEREAMVQVWNQIIGNAQNYENIRIYDQTKGKLNVNRLITQYPSFLETETTGNYKNMKIFSQDFLELQEKKLPEEIEISFVIDNSGSMNEEKIDAACKAVAVTLLSLEDFNTMLDQLRSSNNKINIKTETWMFGSEYQRIKHFNCHSLREMQSQIIQSVTKIEGQAGATNDAACLEEILEHANLREIQEEQKIKMIFEITDGASSFPGQTKKIIDQLIENGVKVFAFQIGNNSVEEINIFNYVWNEGYSNKNGMTLGQNIQKLPIVMLETLKEKFAEIMK